jgi:hypothetical protein
LKEKYNVLRYSIFEHARGCSDPAAVLDAAFNGRLSPGQVKNTYRPVMEELKELMTRVPRKYMDDANQIVLTALAKLKELIES